MQYVAYLRASDKELAKRPGHLEDQLEVIRDFHKVDFVIREKASAGAALPELARATAIAQRKSWTLVVSDSTRIGDDDLVVQTYNLVSGRLAICGLPAFTDARELSRALGLVTEYKALQRRIASIQTRKWMRDAKAKGAVFGSPPENIRRAGARSAVVKRERARKAYAPILPQITRARASGKTLAETAAELNATGHTTREGKQFTAQTVRRIIAREEGR